MTKVVTRHLIGNLWYEHIQDQGYTGLCSNTGDGPLRPTHIKPLNKESRPPDEWLRLADKAGV